MFQVGECLVFAVLGYILLRLDCHPAPTLLGFVLGPRFEDEFPRAIVLSNGDITTFVTRPISAAVQIIVRFRRANLNLPTMPHGLTIDD